MKLKSIKNLVDNNYVQLAYCNSDETSFVYENISSLLQHKPEAQNYEVKGFSTDIEYEEYDVYNNDTDDIDTETRPTFSYLIIYVERN